RGDGDLGPMVRRFAFAGVAGAFEFLVLDVDAMELLVLRLQRFLGHGRRALRHGRDTDDDGQGPDEGHHWRLLSVRDGATMVLPCIRGVKTSPIKARSCGSETGLVTT